VNCIAVNTENIVNASAANKLLPVKLNKRTHNFPKGTYIYCTYFNAQNTYKALYN